MNWYDEEVDELIKKRDQLPYSPQTVFYGSSSIRMWDSLYDEFKDFLPVNLGFGGSTLEACVYYFNRIVEPLQNSQKLIVYAGDNDLGDGKTPEEVFYFFSQLENLIQEHFPNVPSYYISIKPSISRWNIDDNIKQTNNMIESEINSKNGNLRFVNIYDAMLTKEGFPNAEYYDEDGLHLSNKGYELWNRIMLTEVFNQQ